MVISYSDGMVLPSQVPQPTLKSVGESGIAGITSLVIARSSPMILNTFPGCSDQGLQNSFWLNSFKSPQLGLVQYSCLTLFSKFTLNIHPRHSFSLWIFILDTLFHFEYSSSTLGISRQPNSNFQKAFEVLFKPDQTGGVICLQIYIHPGKMWGIHLSSHVTAFSDINHFTPSPVQRSLFQISSLVSVTVWAFEDHGMFYIFWKMWPRTFHLTE